MSYVQRTFLESGAILESEFLLDKIRRYHRRYSRAVTELDSSRETEFPEHRIRVAPRSICLSVCLKRNSISRFGRSDEMRTVNREETPASESSGILYSPWDTLYIPASN